MLFRSLNALSKNENACENLHEIMSTLVERGLTMENLEARENKILSRERNYANTIADLEEALEEEQTIKKYLEETFTLELSKANETHDRALKVANDFKIKNDELVVEIVRLLEANERKERTRSISWA